MITLFGATGYTGRLIAQRLSASGLPYRLAGRSADRLASLSAELPDKPSFVVADAAQTRSYPDLFADTRVLINCAGPFTDLGERVVAYAALNGVHYLDMTNELGYRYKLRSYHGVAQASGSAVVPACGFEVALADCAAALVGREFSSGEPLDEINVLYVFDSMGTSAGTRQSALRSLATSWISYRDGAWVGTIPGGRVKRFDVNGRTVHALAFPSCESVTVPAHLPVLSISVYMNVGPVARFFAPLGVPLLARLSRSILKFPMLKIAGSGAMGSADKQSEGKFTILVAGKRGQESHTLTLRGRDAYGLTADISLYAVRQMLTPGYGRAGVLSPAQAFDPQGFLNWAKEDGKVELTV